MAACPSFCMFSELTRPKGGFYPRTVAAQELVQCLAGTLSSQLCNPRKLLNFSGHLVMSYGEGVLPGACMCVSLASVAPMSQE